MTRKALLVILFLSLIAVSSNGIIAKDKNAIKVLWQKDMPGFVGHVQLSNNGHVAFMYRPDRNSVFADVVICTPDGGYQWNQRFTGKVRDLAISLSGQYTIVTYMQQTQTSPRPVAVCVEGGKEKWTKPGATWVSFSPGESRILCYNDGKAVSGAFLYDLKGSVLWKSDDLAFESAQCDDSGTRILGVKGNTVVFVDKTGGVLQYRLNDEITQAAFDFDDDVVFAYAKESVFCLKRGEGVRWTMQAPGAVQLKYMGDKKLSIQMPGRRLINSSEASKAALAESLEENVAEELGIQNSPHWFSESGEYLVTYEQSKLTLYRIEVYGVDKG